MADDDDRFYGDDMERRDHQMRRGRRRYRDDDRTSSIDEDARRFARGREPFRDDDANDPGYVVAPGRAARSYGAQYGYEGRGRRGRNEDRGFFDRAGDEIATWFGDEGAERRRRADVPVDQNYRGKGPKNYVRSDARILEDVNDRLTEDHQVDAGEIEVAVAQGEVTLNGTVASRAMKRRAEDVADDVSGVKHTQNNLRVRANPEPSSA